MDLAGYNSVNIPIKAGNIIEMNDTNDYEKTYINVYQRLVENLIYLSYSIKPDILFIVGQLSKRNNHPSIGYLRAANQVIYYLKDIMHLGIIYDTNNSPTHKAINRQPLYGLVGYTNNNYAGNPEDQKSMIGYYFFSNKAVVS